MIFQHTWEKVLSGEKTQTRQLSAPYADGFSIAGKEMIGFPNGVLSVMHGDKSDEKWNVKYQVGKAYSVQPGRGKKAIARIEITDIHYEDVREISDEDVKAEGFDSTTQFLETWTQMHDVPALGYLNADMGFGSYRSLESGIPLYGYEAWQGYLNTRPANRYMAWALTFKLVQP